MLKAAIKIIVNSFGHFFYSCFKSFYLLIIEFDLIV